MNNKKNSKATLKRRFSIFGLAAISFCVAVFSVFQFYLMDDIFALAAKISMLDAAREISQMDFSDPYYLPSISDFEASKGIYIEVYAEDDALNGVDDTDNAEGDACQHDSPDAGADLLLHKAGNAVGIEDDAHNAE